MHQHHSVFEAAIRDRKKVRLTFYSKEDGQRVTRLCAPMDFAASKTAEDRSKRYFFWNYDGKHTLGLVTSQVRAIEVLEDSFDPAEFVTWRPRWSLKRDWGRFS